MVSKGSMGKMETKVQLGRMVSKGLMGKMETKVQ